MTSTALRPSERPGSGGPPGRPHGSPQRRPTARRSRSTLLRAETAAEYFYDYAAQDPINGYDLAGTNTTWPVHPVLGFGLVAIAAWGSTCITNPACNSGSSIIIKRIWDSVVHASSDNPPPSLDRTGKVHGDLPDHPPASWTDEQLKDLGHDLDQSIRNREQEQAQLGEDPGHRARIGQERRLRRQIGKRLGL